MSGLQSGGSGQRAGVVSGPTRSWQISRPSRQADTEDSADYSQLALRKMRR